MPIHHGIKSQETYPIESNLLQNLLPSCSTNGISYERVGGANGLMDISSPTFRYFLKTARLTPKANTSTIFLAVNSPRKNGFQVIYNSPYDERRGHECKSYWYSPPQVGGLQKLTDEKLKENQILMRFPACRVLAAIICVQYNNTITHFHRPVVQVAAWKMLDEWDIACSKSEKETDSFKNNMYHLARTANLTVVTHKVGYHRDVFAGSKYVYQLY